MPNAAAIALSNYFSQVDPDQCNACAACVDHCPMDAISLSAEAVATINLDRCIGCGLCVQQCPTEAIALVSKPEEALREPPYTGLLMRSSQEIESTIEGPQLNRQAGSASR
jgi:ferredoxin